jgi:hypothetical protein
MSDGPKRVRKSLNRRTGQKVDELPYGNRVKLIPARPIAKMRGFLKGIDTAVARDADRV